ncbi:MBL fold metallo-hydrolase [Clostridium botulinum]|uniref:MBL fold metallo-hydrolase n=1 Tax=Clostridium botulinum TaxID=1491 RepID=UPI0006992E15|nr:MBL fold metallo-hydrolase [Clostridium botulinum]KOA94259.1 beta-lactamase [Clostridium botulinum]MCD3204029.1 MBL fold metallo-hydrolase [Clostridium botulinum C/D]MCD3222281.1 MBL fold metallo-hydrolase [Clostridium botulinum C/D]MCD3232076.1 MBL fold metallo-hydrolase [Clostridium botulinum C/D]MCD3273054.1 MBL fold metallo-hydrolase [Clostridium botulinum C/D]
MKLKVLGSGSSGNCYLLQNEKESLIIECGLPYKTILKGLNFDLSNIVGCLVSHEHKDHSKGVKDLIRNGIDVYSSKGTFEAMAITSYRAKKIENEKLIKIGKFIVLPFKAEHDAAEPLGFLIKHNEMGKLLFITDSYYCKYRFNNLKHILVECNYSSDILNERKVPKKLKDRIVKSHFELENVKEFLKCIDLEESREIILIHLSDGNSNAIRFQEEIAALTGKPTYIASEGLELEIGM